MVEVSVEEKTRQSGLGKYSTYRIDLEYFEE